MQRSNYLAWRIRFQLPSEIVQKKKQGIVLVEPCLRLPRMQCLPKDRGLSPREEVAATEADPRQ